jgi:hypothetical protein
MFRAAVDTDVWLLTTATVEMLDDDKIALIRSEALPYEDTLSGKLRSTLLAAVKFGS